MTIVKRLRLLTAALGVTAASAVVGTAVFGDARPARPPAPAAVAGAPGPADDPARTRFTDTPALAYKSAAGETVFAWQVKPALAAAPARPRDLLVMVDTSASQAGGPLDRARAVLAGVVKAAGPDDRVDVWTANINDPAATRSLTGGFQPAAADAVQAALGRLAEAEYGAGAVDLKAALEQAVKQFGRGGRTQAVVYLGDGESAASPAPLTEAGRADLGGMLADREVGFFAVPLGARVHGHNLHGLAAATGGAVVRLAEDVLTADGKAAAGARVRAAVDVPVLRPDRVTFGPEGTEVYPTRLPPLRADRATLVVGKLAAPAQTVTARVEGRANGARVTVDLAERLPAPAPDNYFLAAMAAQWRDAPAKDAPAILPADRTLAVAAEQYRLFRDEFAVQAVWAITADRLDHAEKLFQAAAKVDPDCPEARAGLRVVAQVRAGQLPADKVKAKLRPAAARPARALAELAQDAAQPPADQPPAGGAQPPAPPAGGPQPADRDLIQQARAAQQVLEQEFRVLVDDTIRRGRQLLLTDPDTAYADLKRQQDSVLANDQLSEPVRRRLAQDLEAALREVQLRGAEVKRQLAVERQRIAQARQRLTEFERQQSLEEQTKARIDAFRQLMSQARFELAQQEAQVMIQERVSRGQVVPVEAYASYRIGQAATNLREFNEIRRIREDRFLLTMMQVEKSFVPYPDEPPVHFPPAAVWRELTAGRVERFSTSGLGETAPPALRRLRSVLEGQVERRVNFTEGQLSTITLDALLAQLSREFNEYGLRFVYRTDLFPPDARPGDTRLKTTNNLSGLPLGDFLDVVLRDVNMSFVARPEYIEIGPNTEGSSLRYQDKVTRVFDVAELTIGIPQSVNPGTLYSSIQFQGAFLTIFGAANTPFTGVGLGLGGVGGALGVGGGLGALGGGLGALGGGLGAGGLGAGGLGAGGLGLGGGLQGGGVGGSFQGAGGGVGQAGFTGVQGGLGGQFGIQGNDQSQFLLQLIQTVVAKGEWEQRQVAGATQPLFSQQAIDENVSVVDARDLNSVGFYPPAKALVIRASHRYHQTQSFKLRRGEAVGAGGPGLNRDGKVAAAPARPAQLAPAGADAPKQAARAQAAAVAKQAGKDPEKVWNAAFSKVTSPELAVAAVEGLFEEKEYAHAAEALKAGLRKGRVGDWWAQEALVSALRAAQAAPAEVERAALSAVDLDPDDPNAFLRAARTEGDLGRTDVALAFCQRAAALEPNRPAPYADALLYASKATDVRTDAVEWAATNLLARDWPAGGPDVHARAKDQVGAIARKLSAAGRPADADKVRAAIATDVKARDLVIELLWQGRRADLDLAVVEPTGSRCSATHKRTTGGGVLRADVLEQGDDRAEVYTATQAFPGTYTVAVRSVLDAPVGNRATVKVTKNQGTPAQTVEVFSVDLRDPKPVLVRLDAGTRSELATVPADVSEARLATTGAAAPAPAAGGAGGAGMAGALAAKPAPAVIPLVNPNLETRIPGAAAGMPGLRLEGKVSADRSAVVVAANPVFTGPAVDLPAPKFHLLPGGGD